MDESEVREQGVGHVLVEEGGGADEVECYSVWTVFMTIISNGSMGVDVEGSKRAHIFIASSCSFFGMISSMCGASKG